MLRRAVDEISRDAGRGAGRGGGADQPRPRPRSRPSSESTKRCWPTWPRSKKPWKPSTRETKEKLEADLASLRDDAQQAREQLLADAKQRADRDREEARRAVDEASQQRIKILEQLMGVYRDLESVPAALESAYRHGMQEQPGGGESQRGVTSRHRRRLSKRAGILGAVSIGNRRLSAAQARRIAVAAQGFNEPRPARRDHPRAFEAVDLANPSAATGFGLGGGARPLRAGVQPARPLRPRRAGPRGLGPALVAAAGRVLGARGRTDGRRRLAADALADAPVSAWPLGHAHRQGQSATRRGRRRRRRRTRAEHRRADRSASGRQAAPEKGDLVDPQRHQVGRRGAVRLRGAHHGHPGGFRPPLRPGGAGAAGRVCWPARSTTTRRSAS